MSRWAVALVLACACGRINFDPLTGDEMVDASTDGSTMATCVNWGMWSTPSVIPMLESDGFDWAPTISDDDLRMTFSSDRTGDFELYTSSRPTEASEWSAPVVINELRMDGPEEDDATLSSNELEMLYGNTLIFRTTRTTTSSAWNPPNVLIPNDFDFVQGAELTRDDLRLYFSAGSPNEDLFLMERPTPTSAFGSYARIMPDPDPGNDIGYPAISTDELELYVSSDHGGERDIFVSRRANRMDPFPPVTRNDQLSLAGTNDWDPELSKDGTTMYFASTRAGSQGLDLFVSTRTCND